MATCKDCLHDEVCQAHCDEQHYDGCASCLFTVCIYSENAEKCDHFKDRARFLEMPPVKIGDFAWVIRNYKGIPHAQTGKVTDMYFTREMELHVVVSHIARGAWGKTVFATQEEAEKAIAEKKSQK